MELAILGFVIPKGTGLSLNFPGDFERIRPNVIKSERVNVLNMQAKGETDERIER